MLLAFYSKCPRLSARCIFTYRYILAHNSSVLDLIVTEFAVQILHKMGFTAIATVCANSLWIRCLSNFTEKCLESPLFIITLNVQYSWDNILSLYISILLSSLPYIMVALYTIYGFYKVKLCKLTPFVKHDAITSAYFNLRSSNMAYQNPWWKAIKVICISLRSD